MIRGQYRLFSFSECRVVKSQSYGRLSSMQGRCSPRSGGPSRRSKSPGSTSSGKHKGICVSQRDTVRCPRTANWNDVLTCIIKLTEIVGCVQHWLMKSKLGTCELSAEFILQMLHWMRMLGVCYVGYIHIIRLWLMDESDVFKFE